MTLKLTKITRAFAQLERLRGIYFPERQLFLRSQGRVRFLTIHSYTQITIASGLLIALGWGAVTSYAYLSRDLLLEDKNETITTMTFEYQALSSDFSELEAEVERRTRLLEERQRYLGELLSTAPNDTPNLLPIEADRNTSETETTFDTKNIQTDDIQEEQSQRPEAQELSFLEEWFDPSEKEPALPSTTERRKILIARLKNMAETQQKVVSVLNDAIEQSLDDIDIAIQPSGVSVEALLAVMQEQGSATGGPFIPEPAFEGIFAADDGNSFEELRYSFDRLKMVTNALDSYPHGKPADKYYVSSRFGGRIDPINKVRARHYALDLSGWPGEPIKATASGTVVKAKNIWPYGNMVEIDHGNGFRTRYGHLRKMLVKKNEEIELGHQIGEMGSTGRVTGTHVHYEVWFNGKVIDPMPFMKASNNVLKIQGRNKKDHEKTHE